MKRRNFMALAIAATSVMPLAAAAGDSMDEAAIRALWKNYAAFRVSGDAGAWLALWDKDGIQMPPGTPARKIETLRPVLANAWAKNPRDAMEITPEEIVVAGEWAYTRGTYTADTGDKHFDGKFMTILRRQADGSWRIYRDMFNANA